MLFFELLQISLGNREELSHVPCTDEWVELYNMAERQAVTGILIHGIEKLPAEQRPSQVFLLQWIGIVHMIEQRNHEMDKRCIELLRNIKDAGLHGTIIKGQGIARLYDKELQSLRQSGDIDVYVDCGIRKALAFAKSQGQKDIEWDYKHMHLNLWDDTEVEMHYRIEVFLNLCKNRKLQKWFRANDALLYCNNNDLTTPFIDFNVFYILLHIYRHFLYEGVGFRQIVDFYFVLRSVYNDKKDVSYSLETISRFGLEGFAKGLMWVMHKALGMPREWSLWVPDEKEGEYILSQVMQGGNFGHYDERLQRNRGKLGAVRDILTHNLHLFVHYPSDTLWAPIWIVWHKLWKIKTKIFLPFTNV